MNYRNDDSPTRTPKSRKIPATEKECPFRAKIVDEITARLDADDKYHTSGCSPHWHKVKKGASACACDCGQFHFNLAISSAVEQPAVNRQVPCSNQGSPAILKRSSG